MHSKPLVRLLIIVLVLALFGAAMHPWHKKLKPGLDLAGGTQLLYQVDVPEGQDAKTTVDQVISVLRARIDPDGVMNLIWRQQAGNRIEIQVPEPPAEVKRLRIEYVDSRKQLVAGNISRRRLVSAIKLSGEERMRLLDTLSGTDSDKRQAFIELAAAYDALQSARRPYGAVQQELRDVELRIRLLADDADAKDRQDLESQKQTLVGKIAEPARVFNQAKKLYDDTLGRALATNIGGMELDQVIALADMVPPKSQQKAGQEGKTLREVALEAMLARHPARADDIRAVMERYAAYEKVKGPIDDPNDLINLLKGSGVLEFRISPQPENLADERDYRDQLAQKGPRAGRDRDYRWFVVDDIGSFTEKRGHREKLERNPAGFFQEYHGLIGHLYAGQYYILLANTPDMTLTGAKPDWKVSRAQAGPDQFGFSAVYFNLNAVGGHLMGELTGAHVGRLMAIMLDGRVISAPQLQSKINDAGQITGGSGGFGQAELSYLIRTLNAGSLTGSLSPEPISQKTTGPELGEDNLRHGLKAAIWALILVAAFMAVYYLFWGGVAGFALAANMVLILGAMALKQASFTLPGIAGIILTIGMAVDANVLIFERIREELAGGADLATAVRLGFEKAFSTIIDANITTLITCVVLYNTATAEIKGFALTLGIGIVATLFTALYCSRTLIEIYISIAKPRSIAMLPTMIPAIDRLLTPRVDWVSKRRVFMLASAALVVLGLFVAYGRGEDIFDIEFRSGVQIGFELKEGKTLSLPEVRGRLDKIAETKDMPEMAGDSATVVTVGEVQGDQAGAFNVAVLNEDTNAVSLAIKDGFADSLETERPIQFAKSGESMALAPVYPVGDAVLGANIGRPEVDDDVSDYLGSVVVVVDQLQPVATEADITRRIERMRMQPQFEALGYRQFVVIGLDVAADADTPAGNDFYYRSAVVVVTDGVTNYIDRPDKFATDPEGLAATEWEVVRDALLRDTSLRSVSKFSSQVSNTMKWQAIQAMVLSLLAVVAYIWLRFGSLRYGLAAIVALVHDVAISIGLLAVSYYAFNTVFGRALMLSDFKINLAIVAALLTIVGYSLNDTIVVFDRIRENRGKLVSITAGIVNNSINQTISRTVITSGTTLIAVLTLYIFGGDGVHGFAFTLLIGVVAGTYSSIAIASPILLFGRSHSADPAKADHGT